MSLDFLEDYKGLNLENDYVPIECPECGNEFKYTPHTKRSRSRRQGRCPECGNKCYIDNNRIDE